MFLKLLRACDMLSRLIGWLAVKLFFACLLAPVWFWAYLLWQLLF